MVMLMTRSSSTVAIRRDVDRALTAHAGLAQAPPRRRQPAMRRARRCSSRTAVTSATTTGHGGAAGAGLRRIHCRSGRLSHTCARLVATCRRTRPRSCQSRISPTFTPT
jgi:hypothetical protein